MIIRLEWWERRRHSAAQRGASDDGTTLIELVVGMVLMGIFMSMFTGAVVMMNSAENKAESVNNSSMQLNQAFLALDRTVRYATAITTPGTGSSTGDWYVEMRTTNTGSASCTQLWVDTAAHMLKKRTWLETGAIPTAITPVFTSIASTITNTNSASPAPFALQAPSDTIPFQQLTISLLSVSKSGSTQTPSQSAFTFQAVNSTIPVANPVCSAARQ